MNLDFEESTKKKVDGEDNGPGKGPGVKGNERSRVSLYRLPFPRFPSCRFTLDFELRSMSNSAAIDGISWGRRLVTGVRQLSRGVEMIEVTDIDKRKTRGVAIAFAIFFVVNATAVAQTPKPDSAVFQLGDQATRIPAPEGFEEAASQFEVIKDQFTRTEAPENDMLAVHLPHADCERLRAGEFGPFNFNTKISVRRVVRDQAYSAERFANLVATFRKNGTEILDVNGPTMKSAIKRLDNSLSELNKQETQVDLSQPINLGEFDTRPNVYSVMLVLNFKTKSGDGEVSVPILGSLSYVRVGQRLIYVYTYRKYISAGDVEVLRNFTKKWIGQILAAN